MDLAEATGYFGPETVTWKLYREPLFVLGGVRALILQVAHPAVADGVARFSNFQADPFGRGYRTFAAMAMIYFGDKRQAEATAQRLRRIHSGIRGAYETGFDNFSQVVKSEYSANDPDLLFWVLATLTDTTLRVYEWLPASDLPPDWKEQFYEESKIAARLLGISDEVYPANLQDFNRRFSDTLDGPLLGSAETCRAMTHAILHHPRSPEKLASLFAAGWLPAPLCERLGIDAGAGPVARLERLLRNLSWLYRLIPRPLRYNPAYHQARYRIAKAEGRPPTLTGRFFFWLGKRMKVPLGLEIAKNCLT